MSRWWLDDASIVPRQFTTKRNPETGEMETVGKISKQLQKAFDIVKERGVSAMTRDELKQVARPLIREANLRYRELERAGLTDTPAFRYLKNEIGKLSAAGTNTNTIKKNIHKAYGFLASKTSTVSGARDYLSSTVESWIGAKTSKEQREQLWDLYHRLEKIHPGYFSSELYSSGELADDMSIIYDVLNRNDWDIDRATEELTKESGIDDIESFEERDYDVARAQARWIGG